MNTRQKTWQRAWACLVWPAALMLTSSPYGLAGAATQRPITTLTQAEKEDIASRRAMFLGMCRYASPSQRATLEAWARSKSMPFGDRFCNAQAQQYFDEPMRREVNNVIIISYPTPDMDLSPFEHISSVTKFVVYGLSGAKITDLSPLSRNTNMRYIAVANNRIKDISVLANFKNLETLIARDNLIEDISLLAGLKNLQKLDLTDNPLQDDLTPLAELKALKELRLSVGRENRGFSSVEALRGLVNLESLSVRVKLPLKDELEGLSKIQRLIIFGPISNVCSLAGYVDLVSLGLINSGLSDISCLKGLLKLRLLYVRGNPLRDISGILPLPELTDLDVSDTLIEDLSAFTGNSHMHDVTAKGTPLRWCSPKTARDIKDGVSCFNPDGTEKPWWKRLLRM